MANQPVRELTGCKLVFWQESQYFGGSGVCTL